MLSCTAAPCRAYRPVPSITGVRFICARMYTGSGLELFAIAVVCKEVCISNSCPIFTLAAEQVVIHCITTAHQNAKLVSISSSRADRSYTYSLYFAHREQVQHCTLAHRERVQTLLQRSTTTLYFSSSRASASCPRQPTYRSKLRRGTPRAYTPVKW